MHEKSYESSEYIWGGVLNETADCEDGEECKA